jgi:hypothetical protein
MPACSKVQLAAIQVFRLAKLEAVSQKETPGIARQDMNLEGRVFQKAHTLAFRPIDDGLMRGLQVSAT